MYVVIGDEYVDFYCFEMMDDFLDVEYGDWVDVGEWFVEKDELWVDGESLSDFEMVLFVV